MAHLAHPRLKRHGGQEEIMAEKPSLLVIVPSRLKQGADGKLFLEKAISSIARQSAAANLAIDIAVGVDPGQAAPGGTGFPANVRFVQAAAASQAAALNAAAKGFSHAYLAILEDDDEWHPSFLAVAMNALQRAAFVSSTQIEATPRGDVVCIYDFPTPSGWVMERKAWESVGGFDETYRYHLDNEWLGRLGNAGVKRAHLVEATAPLEPSRLMKLRPCLHLVLTNGGTASSLLRHQSPLPLVRRLVHEGSGMHAIGSDAQAQERSKTEIAQLKDRFGRIPW